MNESTHELVACNVLASPALTRRIRKAAFAEQEGQDPRAALMIAAGYKPDEFNSLRTQVNHLTEDANESDHKLSSLKAKSEKCAADLSQTRKQLSEKDGIVGSLREEKKLASERITALEDTLRHAVDIHDLPSETTDDIRVLIDNIRSGIDPRSAFLTAADYDRRVVDDALSSVEPLKAVNAELERRAAPINATLDAGGVKAWIVRQALGGRLVDRDQSHKGKR
jgi:chromosome segregation ATPase